MADKTIDQLYPCPQCGEHRLVYDGWLAWRSGPRPLRQWASKRPLPFSPRADRERERCYHCEHCGVEFFEDMETTRINLYVEGGAGSYTYDEAAGGWRRER